MKKKALKKLSKALRSGKFSQYRGSCYNNGAYCVLGVANNIFGGFEGKEQSELYSLVQDAQKAIGFKDQMPYFLGIGFHILNDGGSSKPVVKDLEPLSFDDIAVLEGPKKYFHSGNDPAFNF